MPVAPTYRTPGPYFATSQTPALSGTTGQGALIVVLGTAPKGSSMPGLTTYLSAADGFRDYGDPVKNPGYSVPAAMQAIFAQSQPGSPDTPRVVVARVGTSAATGTATGSTGSVAMTALPAYAGSAGNAITVVAQAANTSAYTQSLTVYDGTGYVSETYSVYDPTGGTQAAGIFYTDLLQQSQIVTASSYTDGAWFTAGTFTFAGGADGQNGTIQQADLDKLQALDVDFVIPLQGDLATIQMAQTHCQTMRSNGKPRMLWAGFPIGTQDATLINNAAALADQVGGTALFGHDSVAVYNPALGQSVLQPGYIGACLLAGKKASGRPEDPILGGLIAGITGVGLPGTYQTDSQLASKSAAGLIVLTKASGAWAVRDDITTASYGSNIYYILVIRTCEDQLEKRLNRVARAQLIGKPGGPDTAGNIGSAVSAACAQAVADGLISSYRAVTASPNLQVAGAWSVSLYYVPRGEVREIDFTFAVGLS